MEINTKQINHGFFVTQLILRGLTAMLSFVAIIVMIKSAQSTMVFGIEFQARYSYSSAFRCLLITDVIICISSVISLIITRVSYAPNSKPRTFFFLFAHDLIGTIMMISGCAAAAAIGDVGRNGQDQTGWTKICDNVNKFCNFITISVSFSFLAFLCLFFLTLMTSTRNNF